MTVLLEISLLSEVDYVLCLDALGNGNELNLHVSKPPKDKSAAALLYQVLYLLLPLDPTERILILSSPIFSTA